MKKYEGMPKTVSYDLPKQRRFQSWLRNRHRPGGRLNTSFRVEELLSATANMQGLERIHDRLSWDALNTTEQQRFVGQGLFCSGTFASCSQMRRTVGADTIRRRRFGTVACALTKDITLLLSVNNLRRQYGGLRGRLARSVKGAPDNIGLTV